MDFPSYKRVDVPDNLESKKHIVKEQDHKSVLLQDESFGELFKKGVVLFSDSDETYLFLDPISGKKLTLPYSGLKWLMVRAE